MVALYIHLCMVGCQRQRGGGSMEKHMVNEEQNHTRGKGGENVICVHQEATFRDNRCYLFDRLPSWVRCQRSCKAHT